MKNTQMNLESCAATLIEFIASSEHVMVPLTGIHTTANSNTTAAASSSHNSSVAHSRTSSMHSLGSGQHHSRTASANVAAVTGGIGASADSQLQLEDPNMHPDQLLTDGSSVTAHEALSHFSPQLSDRHHFSNSFRPVARVLSRCPRAVVDSFIHLIHHHFVAPLINAASTQGQTFLRDQVRSGKLTKYIVTDGNGLRTMTGGGQIGVDDEEDTFIVPYVAPIVLQYDLSKSTEEGPTSAGGGNNSVPTTATTASSSSPIHSSSTIGEGLFSSGLDVDNLEVFAVLYTLDDCITFLCLHLLHGTANNKINDDGSDVATTTTARQHGLYGQRGSGATVNHQEDFSGGSAFDLGEYPSYSEHLPPLHPSSSPKQQQQSGNDDNSSNAIMAYVWHTCGAWLLDLCEAFYRIQSVEQQQQDDEEENEIRQQKQRSAGKKQTPHFHQTGGISTGIASHKSAYIPATGWSPIGCFTKSLTHIIKKEEQHTAATTGSGNNLHLLTSSDVWGSIADTLELYERQMYRLYRTGRAKSGDASTVLLELPAADGVRTATSVFMEQPLNGLLDEVESIDAERRFEQGGKGIVGLIMKASFFTALDCRVSAVRVQPNNAVALNNLGVQLAMPPPVFTSHDGADESDDETNLNGMPSVIRIDRTTLGRLGGLASLNNTISSLHEDGNNDNNTPTASASQLQSYTKQQCYLRAIEADSTFGLPWKNLADTITVPKSVVTVDDEQECGVLVGERLYSREDCVVECILRDPTNPDAWNHLGCLLAEREIRRAAAPKAIAATVPVREEDEALKSREPDSETVATATTTEGEAGDELSDAPASTLPPLKSKSYLGREGTQESVLRSSVGGSQQRRRAMDDMDADSPAFALIGESAVTKVHCFIKSLELCEDVTGDVWNNLGAALQDNFIVGDGGKGDSKKKKKKVSKKSDEKLAKKKEQQETTSSAPFGNESDEASYAANTVAAVKLVLSGDVERIGENAGGNSVTQSSSNDNNNNSIFNVTQGVKQSVPSMVRINGEWFSKEDCLEKARRLGCDGADENIDDMIEVRRDLQERYGKQAKEGGGGGCAIQ